MKKSIISFILIFDGFDLRAPLLVQTLKTAWSLEKRPLFAKVVNLVLQILLAVLDAFYLITADAVDQVLFKRRPAFNKSPQLNKGRMGL